MVPKIEDFLREQEARGYEPLASILEPFRNQPFPSIPSQGFQGGKSVQASCFLPWSLVKQNGKHLTVSPLKCKCWECARCGPLKKKQLQWKARAGKPTKMITLTSSGDYYHRREMQAQVLRTSWAQVRRKIQRIWPQQKIEFIAVFEKTKAGSPHLHILARMKYVPQAWLSREMGRLAGAPIVDIRRIKNRKMASAYVAKYVAKSPARFIGCKRYWTSMNYGEKSVPAKEKGTAFLEGYYVLRQPPGKVHNVLSLTYTSLGTEGTTARYLWEQDRAPPSRPGHPTENWATG